MSDLFIGIDVGGTKIASATLRDGELSEPDLASPAAHVRPPAGELTVFLDPPAAASW